MPIDYKQYDPNWKLISRQTIADAGNRCEMCYAPNGARICWTPYWAHPWIFADDLPVDRDCKITKVVLTVHHIDGDKKNNTKQNLICLCQRHHLRLDMQKHMRNRARSRAAKAGYLHEAGEWNIQPELAIPAVRPCPTCGTSDVKCHGRIWTCCQCGADWTYNPDGGEA